MQGNYEEAAKIVDRLVKDFPDDPSASLLRGHIYCYGLQQYDIAKEQYHSVLSLTTNEEFTGYANEGLAYISQFDSGSHAPAEGAFGTADDSFSDHPAATTWQDSEGLDLGNEFNGDDFDADDFNFDDLNFNAAPEGEHLQNFEGSESSSSPFGNDNFSNDFNLGEEENSFADPFALDQVLADTLEDDAPVQPPADNATNFSGTNAFAEPDAFAGTGSEPNFNLGTEPGMGPPDFSSELQDFDDAFAPLDLSDASQSQYEPFSTGSGQPEATAPEAPHPFSESVSSSRQRG